LNNIVNEFNALWGKLLVFKNMGGSGFPGGSHSEFKNVDFNVTSSAEKYDKKIRSVVPENLKYDVGRMFVPMLRGLRPTHGSVKQ
jgi:hypothetical protein